MSFVTTIAPTLSLAIFGDSLAAWRLDRSKTNANNPATLPTPDFIDVFPSLEYEATFQTPRLNGTISF
jgi:hypothetical protein